MNTHINSFIVSTVDKFFVLSDLVWDMLPYLVVGCGVLCLILAGILSRSPGRTVNE